MDLAISALTHPRYRTRRVSRVLANHVRGGVEPRGREREDHTDCEDGCEDHTTIRLSPNQLVLTWSASRGSATFRNKDIQRLEHTHASYQDA